MIRHLCEECGHEVDPDHPNVVHAVQICQAGGYGATREDLEGTVVLFHETCFDEGDPRYRQRAGGRERA
jgi:hypothetical protein